MIQLKKGQRLKLSDYVNGTRFTVSISTKVSRGGMDYSCFGVDQNDVLSDDRYFVFYNQISTPDNAIIMIQQTEYTEFQIDLKKLPATIKKMVFVITGDDDITMKNITDGQMKILENTQTKGEYCFNGDTFHQEKAIILLELYEKDDVWKLSIVASGYNGGLSTLLEHFGGEEIKADSTSAPPAPSSVTSAPKAATVLPSQPPESIIIPVKKIVTSEPIKTDEPAAILKPISLTKTGDSQQIDLTKNNRPIHVNLNWSNCKSKGLFGIKNNIDLDLACMYRLKNGKIGVIQALGNVFGDKNREPYIYLDGDDRSGVNKNGENMYFYKLDHIDFLVVFTFIYEGTPNWKNTKTVVTLFQEGAPDIQISIDSNNNNSRSYVIASMKNVNNQLKITCEDKYFTGHLQIDKHYGFGIKWGYGSK